MSAGGGTRAIIAALLANAGIAVAKFVGFVITGSSSMLAEAVHSVADTSNQGLLLLGGRRAKRSATREHPFGFGRERYFYAFVVAVVIFSLGALFSLYEGVHKLQEASHGAKLESPLVAVVILVVAIGLETFSFRTAVKESKPLKGDMTWVQFIRRAKVPELPVVLLEDLGALVGLTLALIGVSLSWATGSLVWDALGTLAIGILLGVIAAILIFETKSLLIGESASERDEELVRQALEETPGVERLINLRTQHMGPEELLVGAKIALTQVESAEDVAQTIDAAERRVREALPSAAMIFLEPDVWSDEADRAGRDVDSRPPGTAPGSRRAGVKDAKPAGADASTPPSGSGSGSS